MIELLKLLAENYAFWIVAVGILLLPRPKKIKFLIDTKRIQHAALIAVLDKMAVVAEIWVFNMGFSYKWMILTSVIGYICRPLIMAEIGLGIMNSEKRWKLIFAPAFLNAMIVSTAFFSDIVFTRTPELEFRRGPLGYTTHIVCVLYFLWYLFMQYRYYRQGERRKDKYCVMLFTLTALIAAGLETFGFASNILDSTIVVASIFTYIYTYVQYTNRDPLTLLLNRQAYYDYIESNAKKIVGIISIDMNGLKDVNDNLGHDAGDEALAKIGAVLRRNAGPYVKAYRIGRDEFTVICIRCTIEDVQSTAKFLEEELGKKEYSCSVGYAIQDGTKELDDLSKEADAGMYLAKRKYYEAHDRRKPRVMPC